MPKPRDEQRDEAEEEGEGPPEGPDGYVRMKTPNRKKREIFGVVDQALGGGHLKILGQDGKMRLGRIRGKLKKRMWMREGDLVIITPWEFQDDKCDILYRYTHIQAQNLVRRGVVPSHLASLVA